MSGPGDYVKTVQFMSEKLEEGLTSGKDILIFSKAIWKHMFPNSNIDQIFDVLISEDDFNVGEITYAIEQFFKSNSQDFPKFLKEHFGITINKNTEL